MAEGGQRIIRVGLIIPREDLHEMDKNTIYVSLRQYGGSISAGAVSRENFRYKARAIAGNILDCEDKKTTTEGSSSHEGLPITTFNYEDFIKMLVKENNGIVKNKCLEDGLEIRSRLEKVRDVSSLNLNQS